MINWFKNLFTSNTCAICKKKAHSSRKYYNDFGQPVVVCPLCVDYAERRAFRKR